MLSRAIGAGFNNRGRLLLEEAGGRVVIIAYIPKPMSQRPWGPPRARQFPREQMDREMAGAGFTVLAAYDFLPEQFFVIYGAR